MKFSSVFPRVFLVIALVSSLGSAALAAEPGSMPAKAKSQAEAAVDALININSAPVEKLRELSGIGEKKAKAIVSYREKHGNFASLDDLLEVKGIGESFIEKNGHLIKFR